MKKSFFVIVLVALIVLVGCKEPHVHSYGNPEVKDGKVVRICECGDFVEVENAVAVGTEEALQKAAKDGSKTIYLANDIKLSSVLEISTKVTLDLLGKTIGIDDTVEKDGGIIYVRGGGDLTINDTVGNGGIDVTTSRMMQNMTGKLSSYNGKHPAVWACIAVYPEVERGEDGFYHLTNGNAKLTVNGGSFKAPYYGIVGNGTCIDENSTIITVNDGSFEVSDGYVFYHPQNGMLTINDGDFKGTDSALEIRAGEAIIKGGKFSASATPAKVAPNGNGTTTSGAAIAVAQHNTKLPVEVTVSGGDFTGYHAVSVMNTQKNSAEDCQKVGVHVTGGTFTATGKVGETTVDIINIDTDFFKLEGDVAKAKFSVVAK